MNDNLRRLCELTGVQTEWLAVDGHTHQVPKETLIKILCLLDVKTDNDLVIQSEIRRIEESYWKKPLKDCYILRQYYEQPIGPLELTLPAELWEQPQSLDISLEDGTEKTINYIPAQQECMEWREVGGQKMFRINVYLPADLPMGYHKISSPFTINRRQGMQTRSLIITPSASYLPSDFYHRKYWGLGAHLYCLQGEGYYTNGDFADLNKAIELSHHAGADFFGINPLHALYPAQPNIASPYSPSSRSFLNPLYITSAELAQKPVDQEAPNAWIDWEKSFNERDEILRKKYQQFLALDDESPEKTDFANWAAQDEERLINFALYNVIATELGIYNAQLWPAEYKSPDSEASQALGKEKAGEVAYHIWLQWLADSQLSLIAKQAKEKLSIGLYGDMAVGVTSFGADGWSNDVIVTDAVFGAPPDDFSIMGQNWAICPFHPQKLHKEGFETFIHMIRKNMKYCGALRIDHVMGLRQLYWIPKGLSATQGAYVCNPYEEFLGIIALESHRNQCIVVGEDLGTVPWGMREQMDQENLLGYRVFWFEKWAETCLFKRPDTYSYKALASVSTHDLPTISGFWQGRDLAIRRELQVYNSLADQEIAEAERLFEKERLLAALKDQGLLADNITIDNVPMDDLMKALHIYVASSNSQLMMAQLDDLSFEADPLNLPGVDEKIYPNWRRRLSMDIADYAECSDIYSAINENRGK